ncbi:sigma-70 family RNA polymerase sigma factor [Neorhizobium lilium]|uniref:Sigma-70 family RNA polymerase sigma factor n=1 Tax=Neorhizobium lilium TaxID=2503024 RepID=A0A444LHQ0_9HYPH|nr:sigma-70 family RNA polymerase sigma factor [Neorhizobium lilium]
MSLDIPLEANTCHKDVPAPLRARASSVRALRVTNPNLTQTSNQILSNGEMARLLKAVASDRSIEAFEALFRFYAPRVRSFMAMKTGDRQVAEELMQETMVSVWNKAEQFDPERGNVSAWIFTIARNIRIDFYRRRRPSFDPQDPAFVTDDVPSADVAFEQVQDAALLRQAMATLPPDQLDVLKRAFFDDVSHSTIASELGLPLGTVKSRIRLAFEKLRAALEGRR